MKETKTIIKKYKFIISLTCTIVIISSYLIYLNSFKKPNIILIVIDSLRPDHLGCYGYYRNTSPNIDAFSKEAFIFKNALAQSCYTTASVVSFITSSYPSEHKVFETTPEICEGIYMNSSKPTLFELLKKNGYATGLITDMLALFLISGIARGFDSFISAGFNNPGLATESSMNWIKQNKNKNFFIFVHYFGTHFPYSPNLASHLREALLKDDILIPLEDGNNRFGRISRNARDDNITSPNHYINNYDGKILYIDKQIGSVLQSIRELNLEKKYNHYYHV